MNSLDYLPEILNRIGPAIMRLSRSYHLTPQDREDLLQDTLLALVKSQDDIKHLPSWIVSTFKYHCIAKVRYDKRAGRDLVVNTGIELDLLEILDSTSPNMIDRVYTNQYLHKLSGRDRLIVEMYVAGFSEIEVAQATNLSPKSIRKTRNRAIRRILG